MELQVLPLGVLGANCYVLDCGGGICACIDIGDHPDRLLTLLGQRGLTPGGILITHGHYDHVGGVEAVRSRFGCPVYVHEKDANLLKSGRANLAWHFTDEPFEQVQEYRTVGEGDTVTVGERTFQVLHTPGHTPGGVCYLTGKRMFTGDTLFRGSMGRLDLGGNAEEMRASLKRLASLEEDYEVYPGHGEASDLAWERKNNPYLRGI